MDQIDPFLYHLLIQFKGRLGPKWVPECVQKWVKNDPKMGQNDPLLGHLLNHLFTAESYLNCFKTGSKNGSRKWVTK